MSFIKIMVWTLKDIIRWWLVHYILINVAEYLSSKIITILNIAMNYLRI